MRRLGWGLPLGLVLLGLLAAALWHGARPTGPQLRFEHDAYIWQERWTDALRASLDASRDDIRAWRVLSAHVDRQGRFVYPSIDLPVLAAAGRPLVAVVRIEGDIEKFDEAALIAGIVALHGRLRTAPVALAGIEIDHDCATAHLSRYADFLKKLRAALGGGVPLAITALPAWMESPQLAGVLGQVDETILQVHAVRNPLGGLFEPSQARAWVVRFARYGRPFRVALPTYGSLVRFDERGEAESVESEMPLLAGGGERRELSVSPPAVQGLLKTLAGQPVPGLRGVAWFRLPTREDRRAWHVETWRRVMRGLPLEGRVDVAVRAAEPGGVFDIVLRNAGQVDAAIPAKIVFPKHCGVADGIRWYASVTDGQGKSYLDRVESRLLGPGREVQVAWVRCDKNPEKELNIAP